jgi:uncharacterized membrane protein
MHTSLTLLAFRIVHVAIGVFWAGAVVFVAVFLLPSVRAAGPAGGAVMQRMIQARLSLWLMASALLTIVSGFGLYWHDSAGFQSSAWLGSGPGRVFGLGGVFALAAVAVGMAVNAPAARRLGELSGGVQAAARPPAPDELAAMQTLQARLARGTVWTAVLLGLATLAMAVARYVP